MTEKVGTLRELLGELWGRYIERCTPANRYVELVKQRGGTVANDHIAFRTIFVPSYTGSYPVGIEGIERVFCAFGYQRAGEYKFPEKHLFARHYEHVEPEFPRIFISQLQVDEFSEEFQALIREVFVDATDPLGAPPWSIEALLRFFSRRWVIPKEETVRKLAEESQYAAWTLLHGNSVNHFTAYINRQNVAEWPDIETTVEGLRAEGVMLKEEIEGAPGSKLRQTATKPVIEKAPVIRADGTLGEIQWPYAYYEIAERGEVDGKLFTGFLGPQATQLFEMTKKEE